MSQVTKSIYKWQPITDLPDSWQDLSIPELSSLARVWAEQHHRLKESQAVKEFNERLRREWAIETGILERLYTIDRGITQLLIEQGIDAALIPHTATNRPVGEVVRILGDHCGALEGMFEFVANRRELTLSYIRELHQMIARHQEYVEGIDQFGTPVKLKLLRGEWKKQSNNPTRPNGSIYEYCPPLQVAGEMERLIELHNSHKNVPPETSAAWLHHRFTQIHPFQDGNGRIARALATIVFLQAGWFPLIINRDQRSDYIAALEAADFGDLAPLVKLFGQNAKRAFTRALTLSEDVLKGETVLPRILKSLVDVYQTRQRLTEEKYQQVEILANHLAQEANDFLEEIALQIRQEFEKVDSPPSVRVASSHENSEHYYTGQIISTAKDLDYFANVALRRNWVRLHLSNGQKTQIVFSFHYLGKVNRGVMVCAGFVYFPEVNLEMRQELEEDDEPETKFGETHPVCREPFIFSYEDKARLDDLKIELRKWMSEAVSVGLAEWAQRL
jgi:Fic family protein